MNEILLMAFMFGAGFLVATLTIARSYYKLAREAVSGWRESVELLEESSKLVTELKRKLPQVSPIQIKR